MKTVISINMCKQTKQKNDYPAKNISQSVIQCACKHVFKFSIKAWIWSTYQKYILY